MNFSLYWLCSATISFQLVQSLAFLNDVFLLHILPINDKLYECVHNANVAEVIWH